MEKFVLENISQTHKHFLLDILSKVKYLDWKFGYDTLSFPTDDQVERIKAGTYQHKLRVNIRHFGEDTDPGKAGNKSWLTYCGIVTISEWNEETIVRAIYITLIQKLRHEASETFMYKDKTLFHEHRTENIAIPQ